MSTAAIIRGSGNVEVDRLRFHAAMIDVVRLALCTRVTMKTECERTRCCLLFDIKSNRGQFRVSDIWKDLELTSSKQDESSFCV